MGFDLLGNLYVTNFTANSVSQFQAVAMWSVVSEAATTAKPESIVFDNAGGRVRRCEAG